jgi:hypothetical protein
MRRFKPGDVVVDADDKELSIGIVCRHDNHDVWANWRDKAGRWTRELYTNKPASLRLHDDPDEVRGSRVAWLLLHPDDEED